MHVWMVRRCSYWAKAIHICNEVSHTSLWEELNRCSYTYNAVGYFKSFPKVDTGTTIPAFQKFSRQDPQWSSGKVILRSFRGWYVCICQSQISHRWFASLLEVYIFKEICLYIAKSFVNTKTLGSVNLDETEICEYTHGNHISMHV